jgi:hypothetical protein
VTNSWNAHPGFPVMKLMVNHYAITKVGKLCVASIGGDDQLRLWDGLLTWDWVGEFPSFASLKTVVLIYSLSLISENRQGTSQVRNLFQLLP